ncbi:uncharacterized protein N0V89_001162 [Didymosphaeria variabile]|uniref:Uncharacterized protein n=1 Tax=Didymosphaeria variabile TaxID=1932322 RepID=A0A9W8XWN5_9PLEO|nr:uncharacterized protein N0V89_001162 [Didymosphaeria variabile]KAJ4360596.1 hypothetical protein N0V89_001162 [Didymosphaeria variabile]
MRVTHGGPEISTLSSPSATRSPTFVDANSQAKQINTVMAPSSMNKSVLFATKTPFFVSDAEKNGGKRPEQISSYNDRKKAEPTEPARDTRICKSEANMVTHPHIDCSIVRQAGAEEAERARRTQEMRKQFCLETISTPAPFDPNTSEKQTAEERKDLAAEKRSHCNVQRHRRVSCSPTTLKTTPTVKASQGHAFAPQA